MRRPPSSTRRTPAAALAALTTACTTACSGPPPPTIPPRETIGPPREAAIACTPPTSKFAQAWFQLADLDTGRTCHAFIEQDECIVAIFRDCTDRDSSPPRSWQGQIDHQASLELDRTKESAGGVTPRSPLDCTGPVMKQEDEPTWAKLRCRITSAPDEVPHRGLYFEALPGPGVPPVRPIGTRGAAVTVALPPTRIDGYVADLAVLSGRSELWAVVNAGASSAASGVYAGPQPTGSTGSALERLDLALSAPKVLRASADESTIFVADGGAVYAIDAATRAVSPPLDTPSEPVRDVAVLDAGILVARALSTRPAASSRLVLLSPSTSAGGLTVVRTATIAGEVAAIVPTTDTGTAAVAILTFAGQTSAVIIDRSLAVRRTLSLGDFPGAVAYVPERRELVFGLSAPSRFVVFDVPSGARTWEMRIPEAGDVASLLWEPDEQRLLAGARGGLLTAVDLAHRRPYLQSRIDFGSTLNAVRTDARTGVRYVLRGAEGYVDVLE